MLVFFSLETKLADFQAEGRQNRLGARCCLVTVVAGKEVDHTKSKASLIGRMKSTDERAEPILGALLARPSAKRAASDQPQPGQQG